MRNKQFEDLLEEIKDLHNRKNENYAGHGDPYANFKECIRFGVPASTGILVRISDKWCRICNLVNGIPDNVGESIEDTMKDLGTYAFLYILVRRQENEKKKS